jgi:hypothetical protein
MKRLSSSGILSTILLFNISNFNAIINKQYQKEIYAIT